MAFPTSPTTYKLPFDTKVRVGSRRRFVLVREDDDGKASVVARSDSRVALDRDFRKDTDYIIDQLSGRVHYFFGHRYEVSDAHTGKSLSPDGSYTAHTLHGVVTL